MTMMRIRSGNVQMPHVQKETKFKNILTLAHQALRSLVKTDTSTTMFYQGKLLFSKIQNKTTKKKKLPPLQELKTVQRKGHKSPHHTACTSSSFCSTRTHFTYHSYCSTYHTVHHTNCTHTLTPISTDVHQQDSSSHSNGRLPYPMSKHQGSHPECPPLKLVILTDLCSHSPFSLNTMDSFATLRLIRGNTAFSRVQSGLFKVVDV